ncbi:MAG: C39 family peptidase [Fimbriimonadaceae bacterium]|nr:C39 family peptidase [Fimbriimonadaceae bacterium]
MLALFTMTSAPTFARLVKVTQLPAFSKDGPVVVELPAIDAKQDWDEAIVSWNIQGSERAGVRIEVQASYPERDTKWYAFADWTGNLAKGPRASILNQKDADGDVLTDTFRVVKPCQRLKVRLTLRQTEDGPLPELKLLAVCFSKSSSLGKVVDPTTRKGTALIDVPKRSQGPYEDGKLSYDRSRVSPSFETWFKGVRQAQYCSPTSLSMVLDYWGQKLNLPSLCVDVPEVVAGVFDEQYPGTGNWPFNCAYAGSFAGLRAYVTRLGMVSDIERIVDRGMPVVCSVAYNLLKGNGKPAGGDGHLVVVVGFTADGDPIINDPGRSDEVRQIYRRANFFRAWQDSKQTAYIVQPINVKMPTLSEASVLRD